MKKIVWISFLLCYASLCSAQVHKGFRWIDNTHILNKVNLETGEISQEKPTEKPVLIGNIQGWDSLRKELPGDFAVVPHYFGDSLVITIPGTGHVYHLDLKTFTCNRLDKTFFRGYNFYANQFVRKDTIFSIGGEGFWQKHSLITYYDPHNFEWSIYKTENHHPFGTLDRFSGYSPKNDVFFSVNINSSFFPDTTDSYLSLFRFATRQWEIKGKLKKKLKEATKGNFKSIWTGEYLLIYDLNQKEDIIIIDPIQNIHYEYECSNDHFFLSIADLYVKGGFLYSRHVTGLGAADKKGLDSLSIKSILKDAKKVGKVYSETLPLAYYGIPLAILLLLGIGIFSWKLKSKSKSCQLALSETELATVKEFIANPHKKFTTLEVNTLLNIEKKTYDNQRQIRNRIISTINQQFLTVLENKELIYRSPNAEDKRMMEYYVNPDLKPKELEKVRESLVISY